MARVVCLVPACGCKGFAALRVNSSERTAWNGSGKAVGSVSRIFLMLAISSNLLLGGSFVLGLLIDTGGTPEAAAAATGDVRIHLLTAVLSLVLVMLVHAIVLTYFMGTGRWVEETSIAYRLGDTFTSRVRRLKYGVLPKLSAGVLLPVLLVPTGAAADPASPIGLPAWIGLSAATLHFLAAASVAVINILINLAEYTAVSQNAGIIAEVMDSVRRIRAEHGLSVEQDAAVSGHTPGPA